MDAFSMLVEFEKLTQVEILSYEYKGSENVLVYDIDRVMQNLKADDFIQNQFLQNYYASSNSFVQLTENPIQTYIANKGMPHAIVLDKYNIEKKDQVYNFIQDSLKKQDINVYAIQHHNKNVVCISYVHELHKYAITMREMTILCEDKWELQQDQGPIHKEVLEIAEMFFQNSKISENQHFQKDLIGRSLIGFQEFRSIKYFGIVEHYNQVQKCLPFNEVRKFLNHYKLECAQIEQVDTKDLGNIYNQFSSQHLTQYFNSLRGWTIYFFSKSQYLTSCYIENRQYRIIQQILYQSQKPQIPNQYQFLKTWNLPEIEEHFYQKVMDFIVEYTNKFGSNNTKSKLVQMAFNAVSLRLKSIPEQMNELKNLQQCFREELIIILPVALKGSGFSELYQQMCLISNEVTIVNSVDKINLNNRIVCINDSFDPQSVMDAIAKINKLPTNAHITVIALMNQGKVYHIQDAFYPFSLNYMINCMLKCNDEEKLRTLIKEIKKFENNKMNLKIGDYQIESRYHNSNNSSQDQDLYSELLVTDFNDTLKNEDKIEQLFESLQNSKVPMQTMNQSYYINEAKYTLEQIEKLTKIKLNKKNVQFKIKQIQGLFIENPDWEILDNFILDGLELISKNTNNSKIQDMFEVLKGQLFEGQNIVYQREAQLFISTNQITKNYNKVQIDTMIVVLNGLIILYPRQFSANIKYLDIPIYSYNLDVTKSEIVVGQLLKDIKNLQNSKQKMDNEQFQIKENKIIINEKEWATYLIKQEPIDVDLVGKAMEK